MEKNTKKIVIYGGSFNPPHIGHAIAIESALRLFPCDEFWIMPSGDRKDKKISVSGKHRLAMVKMMVKNLFLQSSVPIKFSSLELDRPALTTTQETKSILEKEHPNYIFWFLIGSDIFGDIKNKWVNGPKLYKSANFLVFKKQNFNIPKKLPSNIVFLEKEIVGVNVSSTFIRGLLAQGKSPLPYVVLPVAEYIRKNRLYRS